MGLVPRLPLLLTATVLAATAASAQILVPAQPTPAPPPQAGPALEVTFDPTRLEVPAGESRQGMLVLRNLLSSTLAVTVRVVTGGGWDATPFETAVTVEPGNSAKIPIQVEAPTTGGSTLLKAVATDPSGRFLGGAVAGASTPLAPPAPVPPDLARPDPADPAPPTSALQEAQGDAAAASSLPGGLPPEALGGGLLALVAGAVAFALRAKEDDRLDFAGFLRENLGKIAKSFGKRGSLRRQ